MGDFAKVDTNGLSKTQQNKISDLDKQADRDFAKQMALMQLQQKMHAQQQEAMTLSAIEKSKDDALKAIIQNLK